jgi:hypothetical protein
MHWLYKKKQKKQNIIPSPVSKYKTRKYHIRGTKLLENKTPSGL